MTPTVPRDSPLSAIALDDERPALDVIEAFAAGVAEVDLRATFTSVAAARAYLAAEAVELLFLDIDMPAASGLEVARELPAGIQVVFTTAYAAYAAESYDVAATDYLVKPFTPERFGRAVARAVERRTALRALEQGVDGAAAPQPLDFRVDYGVQRVDPREITYAESLDNYVRIHRAGSARSLTVRMTMRALGRQLAEATAGARPEDAFVRVHRSYLVRMGAVTGARGRVVEVGGAKIPLGATYRANFRDVLEQRQHGG